MNDLDFIILLHLPVAPFTVKERKRLAWLALINDAEDGGRKEFGDGRILCFLFGFQSNSDSKGIHLSPCRPSSRHSYPPNMYGPPDSSSPQLEGAVSPSYGVLASRVDTPEMTASVRALSL